MTTSTPPALSSATVEAIQEADKAVELFTRSAVFTDPPVTELLGALLCVQRDIAEHLADISGRLQAIESHTLDTANNTHRED